ncbi:hypothetical protein PLESTB_001121700 [Pleodorina starrii]|uniref:Cilia-and flagella-associated protein 96 n=1 Tax=Pleodorina starrii TaxID=330485 RepID=A0A9W6F5K4_9CHLO|nr:hypothetical protein PLESTM_001358900 [Pleodorina starrii]GLC56565.1 hypothetical protein PLESTB_001121700 [Pleodorina starrii]GLC68810.1 hypothetical protein PLESTF_000739700 [Pleodorina starrii]
MADQELFGVFKEENGLAVSGEPYEIPVDIHTRHHGKQFSTPNCSAITGKGREAWFDKDLQLATPADNYSEPLDLPTIVAARTAQEAVPDTSSAAGGRPLHDKPFRPSHPSQRPGKTSGSLYGTFGPISLFFAVPEGSGHDDDHRPITAPQQLQPSLGNIYTNNPKRGGAGYPDQYRLLSGGSYSYAPDEYQRGRTLEKVLKHDARARIQKPFWGGTRANGVFTPDNELYAMPPNKPPPRSRSASDGRPAWRPNNPAAKGRYCGLLSSPTYIPSPESPEKHLRHYPAAAAAAEALKLRNYPSPARPFVPTSAGHKRLSMWSVNPYERVATSAAAAGAGAGAGAARGRTHAPPPPATAAAVQ